MLIFSCVGVRESLFCWEVFTIFQWSRIILSTMVAISHMWLLKFTFKLIKTKNSVPNPHKITRSFSRGSLEAVSKTRMPLTLSNWSLQCWLTDFSLNLFVPGCHHGGEEVLWDRRWGEAQGRALNESDFLELPFGSHWPLMFGLLIDSWLLLSHHGLLMFFQKKASLLEDTLGWVAVLPVSRYPLALSTR